MNELSRETSPYLLQHARNPVFWKAWNPETLQKAKDQNKLMIVSSGYSACHWCHVMEHESFEDQQVADVMNAHFISVKIDREERPDIDALYMKAVQLMTQHGGWPMNVVCLPDGRPVWGGTYFRKNQWIESLEQLAEVYKNEPDRMIEYAEKLHKGIDSISILESARIKTLPPHDSISNQIEKWKKSFDAEFGGHARAPKFMMPTNLNFLLHYGFVHNDVELLEHVNLTLTRMAWGGLFDTVGGGFSRYSVDMKWHVPHFEKMLYDNGQLATVYSRAYKLTQNPLFKEVVEKTLEFVQRELTSPDGGFYSALDADSINSNGKLEEGAFYVWTQAELKEILGDGFGLFSQVFNINDFGHWEHGNYVLIQNRPLDEIAAINNIPEAALRLRKKNWEETLMKVRENRSRPRLDDKILTSWNALMINGYAEAFKAFQNAEYHHTALSQMNLMLKRCWQADGKLMRNFKAGAATISGFLDDYALTIQAMLSLYEISLDENWLRQAKQLTDYTFDHFYDADAGFFRYSPDTDQALISPHYEIEDNVIAASNSVMADVLSRLSVFFGNRHYEDTAVRMLAHIVPNIDYPSAFSGWLEAFMRFSDQSRELAVCGKSAMEFANTLNSQYHPHVVIAATDSPSDLPFLKDRFSPGRDLYYVCRQKTCDLPVENAQDVLNMLKISR